MNPTDPKTDPTLGVLYDIGIQSTHLPIEDCVAALRQGYVVEASSQLRATAGQLVQCFPCFTAYTPHLFGPADPVDSLPAWSIVDQQSGPYIKFSDFDSPAVQVPGESRQSFPMIRCRLELGFTLTLSIFRMMHPPWIRFGWGPKPLEANRAFVYSFSGKTAGDIEGAIQRHIDTSPKNDAAHAYFTALRRTRTSPTPSE